MPTFSAGPNDAEETDCEAAPPAAEEMSGLSVTDDLNLTVTLSEPETFFNQRLGYTAYYPLPEAFFADPAAFNEAPIGNGPFMMDGSWEHDVEIRTVAYPDFAGPDPAQVDGLTFRIYADVEAAINDLLAGNIDIVDNMTPPRARRGQAAVPNFAESPSSSISYLGMPLYDPAFENPDVRAALSMAIDRQTLVNSPIFNGSRHAAFNLVSPVIPGYEETVCDNWNYDPEQAAALWESSGGIEGPITVWFNSGSGHEEWVEAVVNMWAETLGIDPDERSHSSSSNSPTTCPVSTTKGSPVRSVSAGVWTTHIRRTTGSCCWTAGSCRLGGSNSSFYINPEFDAKIDEANSEADLEAALPVYHEAASDRVR